MDTFNSVLFPADRGGCAFYRMSAPSWNLQSVTRNLIVIDSMKLIGDPNFFVDIRMVRLQRQVNDIQTKYFLEFLKPLSEKLGFWLVYDVDDVIKYEDIPAYNHGKAAYENQQFYHNVKNMLDACDFLTVQSESLKKYYISNYNVDPSKVLVIHDYLPRWWIGQAYQEERIMQSFDENTKPGKRPRIAFPLSSSHFDLEGKNNYVDDFHIVADFVRKTCHKYEYVLIGHVPKLIEDLIKDGKVSVAPGSDILNYPRELCEKNIQLTIAPLQDNIFNRCKANIKLLESWSLGIPCIAQDLECYQPYTENLFKDTNQLQNRIDALLGKRKNYLNHIRHNRNVIDYGDKNAPNGWWLEKNIQQWYNLFTMPQKTLYYDILNVPTAAKQTDGIVINL